MSGTPLIDPAIAAEYTAKGWWGTRTAADYVAEHAKRTPEKTAIYSYEREHAAFSPEEQARFEANESAWANWQRMPPGYRRQATWWVTSAKRPETRAKRLGELIEQSAEGRKPRSITPPSER